MSRLALIGVLGFLAWYILVWGSTEAQIVTQQPCGESVACLTHMVKDLQDHRAFLEDQVALAKSLNDALRRDLAACHPVPELPPKPEPEAPPK